MINRGNLLNLEFELLAYSLDILWVFLDGSTKEREDATVLLQNLVCILARMDSLTNIYNRYGFDELAEKMIAKNPKSAFCGCTP